MKDKDILCPRIFPRAEQSGEIIVGKRINICCAATFMAGHLISDEALVNPCPISNHAYHERTSLPAKYTRTFKKPCIKTESKW